MTEPDARASPLRIGPTPAAPSAPPTRADTARLAGWVHRRRDHGQLVFLDLRDRHGITQVVVDAADAPDAHAAAARCRTEFVVTVEGDVAHRLPGSRERAPGHGRHRAPGPRADDPVRGEDAALLHQRARRAGRRVGPPPVPLPRHPARADAAPPPPAVEARVGDPARPRGARLRRGRDADPHQEHAGGRPRLHRPVAAAAGDRLRPAPEPPAAQAAPHGRRDGSLLPDRPLLPRRGPPRRPPARVHPARPGDELRRPRGR